jgi:hypothetical protein
MAVLFETTDPRGKKVICTEEIWLIHVLDGHPEMEGLEDEVRQAVQTPLYRMIFADRDYPEKNIYYRKRNQKTYVKVVVEFLNEDGILITAYLTDSVKPGERLLWTPVSKNL